MLKKTLFIILSLTILFGSIKADALGISKSSVLELSREAEHYYNTNLDIADMYVTHVNDGLYEISHYTQSGKTLCLQFYNTDWGTWNLGDLTIGSNFVKKTVIGGGTDWEYVFRVYNPVNQNLEFTGGNHGSEVCNSLTMYDSVTGQTIDIAVGEAKYVNRLVIVEETTVFLPNLNYLPYANVKRTYTIVGNTVNLDSEVTFTRDVKMAQSYTAMACVNKDFSRYSNFDSLAYHMTSAKGSCSNEYFGKVAASECTLSGDDTSVTVTVGIFEEKDMTDNFSNRDKTFLWDMTESYNKLYFSKYNMTALNLITDGTVWKFAAYWRVNLN